MAATRRQFIRNAAAFAAAAIVAPQLLAHELAAKPSLEISLAEWSFHKVLFSNKMSNLDFPVVAKKQFGISTVEYVNQFFKDKAEDHKYWRQLLDKEAKNFDAISVAIPDHNHAKVALAGMQLGKHAYVQKPPYSRHLRGPRPNRSRQTLQSSDIYG